MLNPDTIPTAPGLIVAAVFTIIALLQYRANR